jgi:excisionase family DNA binding protein
VTNRRNTSGQRRKVEEAKRVVQEALGDAAMRDQPQSESYVPLSLRPVDAVPVKSETIGVLFPGEAAARLGITDDEVRRMIASRRMKSLRVGGYSVVVPTSEVERLRPSNA